MSTLPSEVLLRIFDLLPVRDLASAGQTCRKWFHLSRDEVAWKKRLYAAYTPQERLDSTQPPFSDANSYLSTYIDLSNRVPRVCTQTCTAHDDEVLHVAVSHRGHLACTTSKDSTAIVWQIDPVAHRLSLYDRIGTPDLDVMYSEFNSTDELLLVTGGHTFEGEIRVYDVSRKEVVMTFESVPYDSFGVWTSEKEFLCGQRFMELTDNHWSVHLCNASTGERTLFGTYDERVLLPKSVSHHEPEVVTMLFTMEKNRPIPHCVGFSQRKDQSTASTIFNSVDLDCVVIGLVFSRDRQYLYCNCRSFRNKDDPTSFDVDDDITTRVFRLDHVDLRLEPVQTLRGHKGFTPGRQCFLIYLDVDEDYVARYTDASFLRSAQRKTQKYL